ncbi:MAG: TolC family protein, partial [Burkholderiales bacterium]
MNDLNDSETMFASDGYQFHHRRTESRNDTSGSKTPLSPATLRIHVANNHFGFALAIIAFTLAAALTPARAAETLTLEHAEKLFLDRNREIQFARRAVESSEADVLSASAAPNPELSIGSSRISPSVGIGTGPLSQKRMDTVIGISQIFERGNKRGLRTEAAQFSAVAARHDESDILRQQRQGLYFAYYDLLLAQERLKIAETTAELFEKSVTAAERRFSAGDIAATDLSRIRVDALRARNDARSAKADLQRNQFGLAYLIGAEQDA